MICVKAKTRIQVSLLCFSQAYDAYPLTQYENTLPKICHVIDGHLYSMSHTFTAIYPPCYEEAQELSGRSLLSENLITSYISILGLLVGLSNRNLLSNSSGDQMSEIKVFYQP